MVTGSTCRDGSEIHVGFARDPGPGWRISLSADFRHRDANKLSGKRRRALLESNAPSNTRERGGSIRQLAEAGLTPCLRFLFEVATPVTARLTNHAGGEPLLWLKKLPQGPAIAGPEDIGCRRHPTAEASISGLQACLIACNPRQIDEVGSSQWSVSAL